MAPTTNIFWCKVFFQAFIKHFRKLNDEQIVRDVRQSMDDLEDLVTDTDTFGSQMVRWALERAEEPAAIASANNGKKGGRPRKNQETTAEAPTREDGDGHHYTGNGALLESGSSANLYGDAAIGDEAEVCTDRESGASAPTTVSNETEARQGQALVSRRTGGHSLRVGNVARPPVRSPGRNSRCPNSREEFHAFVADNNLHENLAEEWYAIHEAREWVDKNGNPIKDWKGALYNYCTKTEQKRRTA